MHNLELSACNNRNFCFTVIFFTFVWIKNSAGNTVMCKVPYGKNKHLSSPGKSRPDSDYSRFMSGKDGTNGVLSAESFRSVPDQMQPGNLLRGQRRACGFVAYQAREVAEFKAGFAHHGRRADPCGYRAHVGADRPTLPVRSERRSERPETGQD